MSSIDNVLKRVTCITLLTAGLIASCTAAPRPPVASTGPANVAREAAISRPVFIEFYSTICAICKQMQPDVNKIEAEYQNRVDFMAYDVAGINNDIRQRYKFMGFPQVVILDGNGEIAFNRLGYQNYTSLKADLDTTLKKQ